MSNALTSAEQFARAIPLLQEGRVLEAEQVLLPLLGDASQPMIPILLATLLPPVYQSIDDLQQWRSRAAALLQQLADRNFSVDLTNYYAVQWFALAYQGMNDRELQRSLARLYRGPELQNVPARRQSGIGEKIRVGFISTFFKDHTIGKLTLGLIEKLDRAQFSVTVFSVNVQNDEMARRFKQHADTYIDIPVQLPLARQMIADQRLDVLYFTDLGMTSPTYTLAFTRFAPVQCTTWGHPDTTGIDTIDYFVSSESLDLPENQDHYSEKLVRLKNLAVYYYRPLPIDGEVTRAQFGLPASGTLYGVPQSSIKIHPDFDLIAGDILRRDPTGTLVVLKGIRPFWDEQLKLRFSRTLADVIDRVHFVDRQSYENFLKLNSIFDVLLDPPHFGGGNTSYEAFAYGIPIVTWPSPLLRGRITYAQYQAMGINDCIANSPQHYSDLAIRLATDSEFNSAVRSRILRKNSVLYENPAGVRELEKFFKLALHQSSEK